MPCHTVVVMCFFYVVLYSVVLGVLYDLHWTTWCGIHSTNHSTDHWFPCSCSCFSFLLTCVVNSFLGHCLFHCCISVFISNLSTLFSSLDRKLTLEDVLLLAVFVYSLIGEECYDSPAQEEELKASIVVNPVSDISHRQKLIGLSILITPLMHLPSGWLGEFVLSSPTNVKNNNQVCFVLLTGAHHCSYYCSCPYLCYFRIH